MQPFYLILPFNKNTTSGLQTLLHIHTPTIEMAENWNESNRQPTTDDSYSISQYKKDALLILIFRELNPACPPWLTEVELREARAVRRTMDEAEFYDLRPQLHEKAVSDCLNDNSALESVVTRFKDGPAGNCEHRRVNDPCSLFSPEEWKKLAESFIEKHWESHLHSHVQPSLFGRSRAIKYQFSEVP